MTCLIISKLKKLTVVVSLLAYSFPIFSPLTVQAETPQEWVKLGQRVHGGFGTYIALGIRIGLDAKERLKAQARDLDVTYQDGPNSPCPCVVDGIMIATVATPGQNSLHVLPSKTNAGLFGVVVIKHKKTGESFRYTIPNSARVLLDGWNKDQKGRARYDAVMNASQESLFHVEKLS
ncbi:formylmethanofuran dehydrogenase subunit E family protein [Mastigocladopsis repens]|uniref:formylmethanofuran dehydrogenase subunit E family protein n=1 Tax=Mastigocladopsis repens TaxID=221287 RepID=UPI0002FB1D69|nr:formylmethanofuran dehydrogenase subunit E family protein [Mastigocladopsis repens]